MKAFETVLGRKCTKSAIVLWYDYAIPHMKALICGFWSPKLKGMVAVLSYAMPSQKGASYMKKNNFVPE